MTDGADTLAREMTPDEASSAGTLLRAARESAGLSVAAVSQQLKLAPRQVTALEDGDWANLPGRTFVRGFVRNYARLLRLDPDAVLAALPETAAPPSHDNSSLAPTPRPMGELPADANVRPSAARWAIPLALVAVVTVAAVYEITRPPVEPAKSAVVARPPTPASVAPSPVAETVPGSASTALPNPLATEEKSASTANDPAAKAEGSDAPTGAVPTFATADTPIAISFQGKSWVEVRDGTGTLVLATTGTKGDTQVIGGQPPFEITLGNAAAVSVTWQGTPVDIAPFTRQNVARFTLR